MCGHRHLCPGLSPGPAAARVGAGGFPGGVYTFEAGGAASHWAPRRRQRRITRAWSGQPRPSTRWTPLYAERGLPLKRKPLERMESDPGLLALVDGWLQFYGAPVIMILISISYFILARSGSSLARRTLTSAHGFVAAILYIGAFLVWILGHSHRSYAVPFLLLHFFPLALIVISAIWYRGPKLVHFLQLPNLAAMWWGIFVGSMAITNEWL